MQKSRIVTQILSLFKIMNIKIIISSIILVVFLLGRLFFNFLLLFLISLYDQFYLYDLITVLAVVLQLISIIGIILKKKWGPLVSIGDGVYDIIINILFASFSMIGGIIVNLIQIGLSFLLYFFIVNDTGLIIQNMQTQQPSTRIKIGASHFLEPPVSLYCPNCGSKVTSSYCDSCGFKIN